MGLHTNLPIYPKTFALLRTITPLVEQMPRGYKHSLGGNLRNECVEMLLDVYRANCAREKEPHIARLLERIQTIEPILLLCMEMRMISRKAYADVILITQNIGKQATGWRKHQALSSVS